MTDGFLAVGRISGVYGVQGWVKVFSYTRPKENIFTYAPWWIGGRPIKLLQSQVHGKGLVGRLDGIADRDSAAALIEQTIEVRRDCLPRLAEGEYYWIDLLGLSVINRDGVELGQVEDVFETGANDVMVVKQGKREHLLPLVLGPIVLAVDLAAKVIRVDWDADFE